MNLAQQMAVVSKTVTNKEKLDVIFNELVLPKIKRIAEQKGNEASFSTFNSTSEDKRVKEIFPKEGSLQSLVGGEMKPYLEEMGFKVILCSPSYYTYIRW